MTTLMRDLRFAIRQIRAKPLFALVVIATLALGIGATTAIFSLVYAMLLRPFPYADPAQLVRLRTVSRQGGAVIREFSLPDLDDYRAQTHAFVDLGVYNTAFVDVLNTSGPAEAVPVARVTPGVFTALGVPAALGRTFEASEDRPGGDVHKAVISHTFWQRHFQADPDVLGRQIRTAQTAYTIVGVMPPGFAFPGRTDLWTTVQSNVALQGADRNKNRAARSWLGIGRLRQGLTLAGAQADLDAIDSRLRLQYPVTNNDFRPQLITLRESETGDIRPYLLLLSGAVIFVLLIGCTNLANMLLARTASRGREVSIRAALGAGRWMLVRQFLTESIVLSFAGGILGLTIAWAAVKAFPLLVPVALPAWMRVELNAEVLAFNILTSVLVGLLFGCVPAWQSTRGNLVDTLKEGAKGSSSLGRLRQALVVAEVAFSLVLLVGAGLMMRSFSRLLQVSPGFQPEHLLTFQVSPFHAGKYFDNVPHYAAFHRRLLNALARTPGLISVAGGNNFPFSAQRSEKDQWTVAAKGDSDQIRRGRGAAFVNDVTPGYFATLGIPIIEGRDFRDDDTLARQMVVIVSKSTAERLFPGRPALGRQIRVEFDNDPDVWGTIIGIVRDVKYSAQAPPMYQLYYPDTQYTGSIFRVGVRFQGNVRATAAAIQRILGEAAPDVAIRDMKAMDAIIADSLWQQRLWGMLLASFAGLALALAALGVYGVMSYLVNQRTRELGIRMALGARPATVLGLVTTDGLRLVAIGVAIGIATSLALSRLLNSLLFQVTTSDPQTYLSVSALLLFVAALACAIPAHRATRIDPTTALRQE
jgi:putative ABC transport system permease protein